MQNQVLSKVIYLQSTILKTYIMYLQKTLSILFITLTMNVFAQENENLSKKGSMQTPTELYKSAMDAFYGNLVPEDIPTAIALFEQAAERGHLAAQLNLTRAYFRGYKVKKNAKKAFYWATLAAKQNNHEAQCYLGEMYLNGRGTKKDTKKGVTWILKAKNQGYVTASNKWNDLLLSAVNS